MFDTIFTYPVLQTGQDKNLV